MGARVPKCFSLQWQQRDSVAGLESTVAACHVGATCCHLTLEVTLEMSEKSASFSSLYKWFNFSHFTSFFHFSSHYICNTFKNRAYFFG